jgi:hypothetical protein
MVRVVQPESGRSFRAAVYDVVGFGAAVALDQATRGEEAGMDCMVKTAADGEIWRN